MSTREEYRQVMSEMELSTDAGRDAICSAMLVYLSSHRGDRMASLFDLDGAGIATFWLPDVKQWLLLTKCDGRVVGVTAQRLQNLASAAEAFRTIPLA